MRVWLAVLSVCVVVSGCATTGANYVPRVDLNGKDTRQLDMDIRECQTYAAETAGAGDGLVIGAVIGALALALLAPHGHKNDWAASGALAGAAGGAVGATENQQSIIKRCLTGRGYSVLY